MRAFSLCLPVGEGSGPMSPQVKETQLTAPDTRTSIQSRGLAPVPDLTRLPGLTSQRCSPRDSVSSWFSLRGHVPATAVAFPEKCARGRGHPHGFRSPWPWETTAGPWPRAAFGNDVAQSTPGPAQFPFASRPLPALESHFPCEAWLASDSAQGPSQAPSHSVHLPVLPGMPVICVVCQSSGVAFSRPRVDVKAPPVCISRSTQRLWTSS